MESNAVFLIEIDGKVIFLMWDDLPNLNSKQAISLKNMLFADIYLKGIDGLT